MTFREPQGMLHFNYMIDLTRHGDIFGGQHSFTLFLSRKFIALIFMDLVHSPGFLAH